MLRLLALTTLLTTGVLGCAEPQSYTPLSDGEQLDETGLRVEKPFALVNAKSENVAIKFCSDGDVIRDVRTLVEVRYMEFYDQIPATAYDVSTAGLQLLMSNTADSERHHVDLQLALSSEDPQATPRWTATTTLPAITCTGGMVKISLLNEGLDVAVGKVVLNQGAPAAP